MADAYLDLVNEGGNVIGRELRSVVHKNGLLHKVVRIWFITPEKNLILQKRSMRKDINPGLLTVAVGGHIDSGYNSIDTARKETLEETGLIVKQDELQFLMQRTKNEKDPVTDLQDYELQDVYGFVFKGRVEDLKVELEDSDGYVVKTWQEMMEPSVELIKQAEPVLFPEFSAIHVELEKLVSCF